MQDNYNGYVDEKNNRILDTWDNTSCSDRIRFVNRIFNPSTITGLLAAIFLFIGLCVPIIDFSAFHKNIGIQYNFGKVCDNIALISPTWKCIPFGILIGAIMIMILSFVNIPVLKLIPTILVIIMFVFVAVDIANVVDWCRDFVNNFIDDSSTRVEIGTVISAISVGAYFFIAGVLLSLISCFLPGARAKNI